MKRYTPLIVLPPASVSPSGTSAASSARGGSSIWMTAVPSSMGRLPKTASRSACQRAIREGSSAGATPSSLEAGASAAAAELRAINKRIFPIWKSSYQDDKATWGIMDLKAHVVGDISTALWVVMGTLGLLLLIACANVANLLLVRAESRQQELAIRSALGAGRGRIAREMLAESLTLGVLGGALGLGLAYAALRILVARGPDTLPRLNEIAIDPLVLSFAFGVSLLSGVLFGVIPIVKCAGPRIATALRGIGRTVSHDRERHRSRHVLVVVQVALALVL